MCKSSEKTAGEPGFPGVGWGHRQPERVVRPSTDVTASQRVTVIPEGDLRAQGKWSRMQAQACGGRGRSAGVPRTATPAFMALSSLVLQ